MGGLNYYEMSKVLIIWHLDLFANQLLFGISIQLLVFKRLRIENLYYDCG